MARAHLQLSSNLWYLPTSEIVVDFAARDSAFSGSDYEETSGDFKFMKWGKNNLQPQEMLDLATANHIKPKLLTTEEEYLFGTGPRVYRRVYDANGDETVKPSSHPMLNGFLDSFDSTAYMMRSANNLVYSANVFTSFVFTPLRTIASIACIDSTDIRAGVIDPKVSDQIQQYGICPDWSTSASEKNPVTVVPAYRSREFQVRAIYHSMRQQMGQKYYAWADWWGTRNWTIVSNLIPLFHKAGLKNGYNIKHLVKVPKSYFNSKGGSDEEIKKQQETLRDQLDSFFSGENNTDKSILTTYDVDNSGRQFPGIVIETIGQTNSDEKYLKLDERANVNQAIGHGVLPALAGIGDGSNKGTSGSELLLTSQMHSALKTSIPRYLLLRPFDIVAYHNGWPKDYFIDFGDVDLMAINQASKNAGDGTKPKVTTNG